jgi:2-polyprenyl-6-methoxyphenol hydroxylase-like FAD-dependent oxidoreductase
MKRVSVNDVPVLIVGAGVAGTAAAITLARSGVECLVVERRREPVTHPRATVVSTRGMEFLRSWGLETAVRAAGVDVELDQWVSATLATAASGRAAAVGYPTRAQATVVSPCAPQCVAQDDLEAVLARHLRGLSAARVVTGTEVVGLENAPDGARVALREMATGATRSVTARYVVAADGAHSAVRRALGIAVSGPPEDLGGVQVVFRAPLWDVLGDCRHGLYAVTRPQAPGVFLPAGRGDRWVFGGFRWDPRHEPAASPTEERVVRALREGSGVSDLAPRVERVGAFTFTGRMADQFRAGATFLVGDAAHRITPRGGTGMNVALQDGIDLAWKLAFVLRGWAGAQLLDSYEAERRPVAEHVLARSLDPDGTNRPAAGELSVDLGGRIRHAWTASGPGRRSTLDLLGPGLSLLTGPDVAGWPAAAAALAPRPVTAARLDMLAARAVGIQDGGALLARPDGVLLAAWAPGTPEVPALRAAVASMATGPCTPDGAARGPDITRAA